MYKKMSFLIIFCAALAPVCLVFAGSFTVKKQKPLPKASNKVRQEFGQDCSRLLQIFPPLLHNLADMHEQATEIIRAFIEEDKQACCMRMPGKHMEECTKKAQALQDKITELNKALQEFLILVQSDTGVIPSA